MKTRTIWSSYGPDSNAVSLAAEVGIGFESNSVDLFVTNGPSVSLSIGEDGRLTVSIFMHGYDVKIESDVGCPDDCGDLNECILCLKENK